MKAKRATLWALFGISALTWSSLAVAQEQPWLRDQRLTSGEGIRTGDFVFHPGISGEFGYDSNLFLRSGGIGAPRVDVFKLAITPHVEFNNRLPTADGGAPGNSPYLLQGSLALSYYEFFKARSSIQEDVSGNRNLGILGGLKLVIAPGAHWSGDVHGAILRTIQPSNLGDPTASYNRTTPRVGTAAIWSPGGGLFSWNVIGYDLTYTYFEAAPFRYLDNYVHEFSSKGQWRFWPRTALIFNSAVGLIRYPDQVTTQPNGDYMRANLGLNGLVTNSVGFTLTGGWMSTFYNTKGNASAQDFDSFTAQAEIRFFLTAPPKREDEAGLYPTTLSFGYLRDANPSYIGNFYQRDRGYGSLSYFFNGVVLGTLSGGAARLAFPATFFSDGSPRNAPFTNTAVDATAFLEYRPGPRIGINLTGIYTHMIGNTLLRGSPTAPANDPFTSYDFRWERYEASLGLRYIL